VISRILHSKDFAADAAKFILTQAKEAIARRGLFRLGLTGGRSPRAVNTALLAIAGDLPWARVQFTFGDERCVPPDHADSNYLTSKESLFDPAGVPGNPKWALAPAEMAWQGKTLGQICEQIKDKSRNGGKDMAALVHHMAEDDLVGWGWHPGGHRTPAPGSQMQFGELIKAWADAGASCPKG
jgi:hypothetical protein